MKVQVKGVSQREGPGVAQYPIGWLYGLARAGMVLCEAVVISKGSEQDELRRRSKSRVFSKGKGSRVAHYPVGRLYGLANAGMVLCEAVEILMSGIRDNFYPSQNHVFSPAGGA